MQKKASQIWLRQAVLNLTNWSYYLRAQLKEPLPPGKGNILVAQSLCNTYREHLLY